MNGNQPAPENTKAASVSEIPLEVQSDLAKKLQEALSKAETLTKIAESHAAREKAEQEARSLRAPWWQQPRMVTIITGIVAAVVPATTAIQGWVERQNAEATQEAQRQEQVRSSYLDRLKTASDPERNAILRFVMKTSSDENLRTWAVAEMALIQKDEEKKLELAKKKAEQDEKERLSAEASAQRADLEKQASLAEVEKNEDVRRARVAEARKKAAEASKLQKEVETLRRERAELQQKLVLPQQLASAVQAPFARRATILWVDDRPSNNDAERTALERDGARVLISLSTDDALRLLEQVPIDLIISDMGRPPDTQAGYTLLTRLQEKGIDVPFFIYSSGGSSEQHREQARKRGAALSTDRPSELTQEVSRALGLRLGATSAQ